MVQQGGHQERLSLQHGTYVGDVSNGKPHGAGTMTFKEDDAAERKTYEGAWLDGKRTGYGCMTWRNGEVCTAQVGPMEYHNGNGSSSIPTPS